MSGSVAVWSQLWCRRETTCIAGVFCGEALPACLYGYYWRGRRTCLDGEPGRCTPTGFWGRVKAV